MSKREFTFAERYAVLEVYSRVCPWCNRPIRDSDFTIDHIIPERLEGSPSELETVKEKFALPDYFSVNSFENWTPAHWKCNLKKGGKIFQSSPAMISFLETARDKGKKARKTAKQIEEQFGIDKIQDKIDEALAEGHFSANDLMDLASKALTLEVGERLHVTEDWRVVSFDSDGIAIVVCGRRSGQTPLGPHHPDWICSRCLLPGPWNGNRCLTCGNFEAPD